MDVETTSFIARWVRIAMFEKNLQWHGINARWKYMEGSLPRKGTSKDLFALYGNGCGVSTIRTTLLQALSSTSPTFSKYAKMRKLFLYALFEILSPLHEEKKQNTHLQRMGLNLRKEIKGLKRGMTRWRWATNLFHFDFIYKISKIVDGPINSL